MDTLRQYARLGTVFAMSYPQSMTDGEMLVRQVREFASDPDFEAIELTHIPWKEAGREAARLCRTGSLAVSYAAQPCQLKDGNSLNALVESQRILAVELIKSCVLEACEMGAESISFLSGPYEQEHVEEAMEQLVKSLEEICTFASQAGEIKVLLEVFDYDVDKCALIGPADRATQLWDRMRKRADNFGLLEDLSHIPLIHETVEQALLPVREAVGQAHIGNCVVEKGRMAYGDCHPRFGFPHSEVGIREAAQYLKTLKEIGFLNKDNRPILSFEVKPYEGEDPQVVMAGNKRVLARAWDMVQEMEAETNGRSIDK